MGRRRLADARAATEGFVRAGGRKRAATWGRGQPDVWAAAMIFLRSFIGLAHFPIFFLMSFPISEIFRRITGGRHQPDGSSLRRFWGVDSSVEAVKKKLMYILRSWSEMVDQYDDETKKKKAP